VLLTPGVRLQQIIDRDGSDRTAVDGQRLQHALSGGSETVARFPSRGRLFSLCLVGHVPFGL
jgi:hypothetical protein